MAPDVYTTSDSLWNGQQLVPKVCANCGGDFAGQPTDTLCVHCCEVSDAG